MGNKKILIAEDDRGIRGLLARKLENLGYIVIQAGNGREALELIEQNCPDILVTDFNMPQMNGFELINELSKRKYKFPIIINAGSSINLDSFNYKNLQENFKLDTNGLLEKLKNLD